MKRKFFPAYILILSFLVENLAALSQVPSFADSTAPGKQLSILNNKYYFVFPSTAKITPRVADIMAADPNINRETRIMLEKGNQKLVFFAQELFALSGKALFEEISKENEPEFNFNRKIIFDEDSVLAILSTPSRFDSASPAILINSLLIKSPDNTVSRVDAFISPEAFPARNEYIKRTEDIFRTISKGIRRVKLEPREESYKIFGTDSKIVFKLPENYYVTVDEKYDFGVFKLNKYKNGITDTSYTGISIYAGHHPSYFHTEYGYSVDKSTKIKGLFLQNPVEWLYFRDDAQSFYLKEQFIQSDFIQQSLVLHVAMLTNKKQVLDELNKIVESIKWVK